MRTHLYRQDRESQLHGAFENISYYGIVDSFFNQLA